MPAAIFVIPYADLMFAIIRRTKAGKPLMAADRQHLHHRVLNIGHSYRQSVLIMYLWAALFSVTVVSLSVVRTRLVVLEAATAVAVLTLLPVTMPRLRPWRLLARRQATPVASRPAAAARQATQSAPRPASPAPRPASPAPRPARPVPAGPVPAGPVPGGASPVGGSPFPPAPFPHTAPFPGGQLPRAGRLPEAGPGSPFAPSYPRRTGRGRLSSPGPFGGPEEPVNGEGSFADGNRYPGPGPAPAAGPAETSDSLAQPRHWDARPW